MAHHAFMVDITLSCYQPIVHGVDFNDFRVCRDGFCGVSDRVCPGLILLMKEGPAHGRWDISRQVGLGYIKSSPKQVNKQCFPTFSALVLTSSCLCFPDDGLHPASANPLFPKLL